MSEAVSLSLGRIFGCLGFALTVLFTPVFAEDDAISFDERRTEDGDVPDERPRVFGEVVVRAREVLPPGSTYQSAPPELQNNLYFYTRTRLGWGPVGATGLVRRASVGPSLSMDNLRTYNLWKGALDWTGETFFRQSVVGHYTMSFGQGLMFYDGFGEFVRPIQVKDRGPRPDTSSGSSDYLRGVSVRCGVGPLGFDLFASEKPLDLPLTPDGRVDFNLDNLHTTTGDVQDQDALDNNNSVTERLGGGRLSATRGGFQGAVAGYGLSFSRVVDPEANTFADARAFRGDRLVLVGGDGSYSNGEWSVAGEWVRSQASGGDTPGSIGQAWTTVGLWSRGPLHGWVGLFDYDPTFVSPHGKGLAFAVSGAPQDVPRNQTGGVLGAEIKAGPWRGRWNATFARFPEAVGNGNNSGALTPSEGRYLLADQTWAPRGPVEIRVMIQERTEETRQDDPSWGVQRLMVQKTEKWRAALTYKVTPRFRWTLRHDVRREQTPDLDETHTGRFWSLDTVVKPWKNTTLKARAYFFNSPDAYLTTGPEEIWDGVVYPRLAGNLGNLRGAPGTRMYVCFRQKIQNSQLWAKYEITRRPASAESRTDPSALARRAWHVEWETAWGKK